MGDKDHLKEKVKYGLCTVDMVYDSRITEIDEGFTDMLGYNADDIAECHLTFRSLIVRDINNNGFKSLTASAVNNGMACAEYFMKHKNGNVISAACFVRSCGDGKLDVMITEEIQGSATGRCDTLTGFYNYASACSEIERLINKDLMEKRSSIVMRLQNTERMDSEYGTAFTGAVIENAATYINHFCRNSEMKYVPGRISRDTFLIFICGEEPQRVCRNAEWIYSQLQKSYYGRTHGITNGINIGVCHMGADDVDYKTAIYKAGAAMECAAANNLGTAVYTDDMNGYQDVFMESNRCEFPAERDERIYDYDNRFVSFAVSLLANARSSESSLDILLQRLAWKYKFNNVLVCKFESGHFVRVINRFEKGRGIILGDDEVSDINDWDNFMRSFDHNGISIVEDTSAEWFSDSDKEFFKKRNIGSSINFLLMDHGRPAGYLSCCNKEANRKMDKMCLNTLIQISKIIEVFFDQHLRYESEERKLTELSKDFATGLYVLPAFYARAREILKDYDSNKCYAVVHTDIDNFSFYNMNYGREAGDAILKQFAKKLEKMCEKGGICCHIEADSFMYMLIRDTKEEVKEELEGFEESFKGIDIGKRVLNNIKTVSGMCFLELDKMDLKSAVYNANLVWKSVKNHRFSSYRIYDEAFMREHENRMNVIGNIRGAIERGEIEAFLQPKFSMKTMKIVGAEALCRWRNSNGTYKSPVSFLPILEEEGQIVDVDFCILEQVLKAIKKWERDGRNIFTISVNFSRAHVSAGDFAQKIIRLTEKYGVNPKYIDIEITESSISSNNEVMLQCMKELRDNGFKMEMDDFGTGFSSLNMLIEAPIDVVKVDKSFIDKYEDPIYRAYIDKIGSLIETAQKDIIFEGVENKEQVKFLTGCGYENAQGFVFSRPIPMEEFEAKYIYND